MVNRRKKLAQAVLPGLIAFSVTVVMAACGAREENSNPNSVLNEGVESTSGQNQEFDSNSNPNNHLDPAPAPAPASGSVPAPASGSVPAPASGSVPAPASGPVPAPASGPVPAPASGPVPAPASGPVLAPRTGAVGVPKSVRNPLNPLTIHCTPNMPAPLIHANPGAAPHHSIYGIDHRKWTASLNIANARALTQEKVLYRWGNPTYEDTRINRIPHVFDLNPGANTINAGGGMLAGVGMYAAETPFEYASFGRGNELYTVTLPRQMPTLDLSNAGVQHALANQIPGSPISNNDIYTLGEDATTVHIPGVGITNAGTPIPAAVKYEWIAGTGVWYWALKTPIGIKFEKFTGKERSTAQLLADIDKAEDRGVKNQYFNKIKATLNKRVYHPTQPEVVPNPLTVVHEVNDWKNQVELNHCVIPSHINLNDAIPLWRRDGSCGSYSTLGNALVDDNISPALCEADFPTRLCQHRTPNFSNTICRRVLQSDMRVVIDPVAVGCGFSDPACP